MTTIWAIVLAKILNRVNGGCLELLGGFYGFMKNFAVNIKDCTNFASDEIVLVIIYPLFENFE